MPVARYWDGSTWKDLGVVLPGLGDLGRGLFSAVQSAQANLAQNTWTKIAFATEEIDRNGWYDAPNSRYTPQEAGTYEFSAAVGCNNVDMGVLVALYKNGANVGTFGAGRANTVVSPGILAGGTLRVDANGTTDYFEVWAYFTTAAAIAAYGRFSGMLLARPGVPGPALVPPRVTSLPASPTDGQEVVYVADAANGILWHLRYNASSASAYKWEFIGGPPLLSRLEADYARTSAAYGDRATVGPDLTIPLAGDWIVECGAVTWSGAALPLTPYMSYDVGATVASDTWSTRTAIATGSAHYQMAPTPYRHNGVAAASLVRAKYKTAGAQACDWFGAWLSAAPVRVG